VKMRRVRAISRKGWMEIIPDNMFPPESSETTCQTGEILKI
jgi:hypothetical protein